MKENQKSVCEWAKSAFGYPPVEATIEKFGQEVEEMVEAADAAQTPRPDPKALHALSGELADCLILLFQIAEAKGVDLQKALDIKMNTNRLRTWAKQSDGTYQHKEEK